MLPLTLAQSATKIVGERAIRNRQFRVNSRTFFGLQLSAHYALATGFHDDLDCAELGLGKTQKIIGMVPEKRTSYKVENILRRSVNDAKDKILEWQN